MCRYLKGGCKEEGVRPFLVMPSNRTEVTYTNQNREVHFECQEIHFSLSKTEHWHRFPMDTAETPSLETFINCLNVVLGNLLKWPYLNKVTR